MKPGAPAAAILSLLLLPALAAAPSVQPGTLEEEVHRLAGQVADIAGKQSGILDRLELLRRRVRLDEAMLRRIAQRREESQEALRAADDQAQTLASKEAEVRRYLLLRMREQYELGVLQQYRVYFAVQSTQDLRSAGLYLQALATRDAASLRSLTSLRQQQEANRAELTQLKANLEQEASQAEAERKTLLGEQGQLSAMLRDLSLERATAQKALDERLAAARSMDRYMNDLSFRKRIDLYSKNMALAEGSLPFPCRGVVVRSFGDTVNPRFQTRVPHPGLDIAAALGSPVRAVFDGIVEYADWLTGYGYTVILSHPGGFFTIYAHLDSITVQKGQTLTQGAQLGTVGEGATTETPALYFELRQGGRAIDPAPWLKGDHHGASR
jgi:septal ring factor EnvC (AmiA/AmiB activator)